MASIESSNKLGTKGLTRRQVVAYGFSAAVGGWTLIGCGGSHRSSGGGGTGIGMTRLSGTVSLPGGMSSNGLVFVAGGSEMAVGNGKVKATVRNDTPTLVSVVDKASSRIVLLGIVDPDAGSFTLNGANVAVALLFLAFGGTQLGSDERQALFTTIGSDAATATLATVVDARLAADPFALENGDAALASAVVTAISNSGARPRDRSSARSALKKRGRSRGKLIRPTPSVVVDHSAREVGFPGSTIGPAAIDNAVLPDCVGLTYFYPLDTAFYAYHTVYAGGFVQSAAKLTGPISIPGARDGLTYSDPIPIGLETATDEVELASYVALTPIFDAPTAPALTLPIYASEASAWRAELADLWQRAVVLMAADIVFEAAGAGRANASVDTLGSALTAAMAVGGLQQGLGRAAAGIEFASCIDAITGFAADDVLHASTLLDVFKPLAPSGVDVSAFRVAQMGGALRVSKLYGLNAAAATYGRVYHAATYDSTANPGPTVAILDAYAINRVIATVKGATANYTPGGDGVKFTVSAAPADYLETYGDHLVYHWKVFGAGKIKLSDTDGKSGMDFDSAQRSVTLTTSSDATGLQTVGVEIFSTIGGERFSITKANASVQTATNSQYALSTVDSRVVPGATGGWTVRQGNNIDLSSWTGLDPNHVRFRWELANDSLGKLGVTAATGTLVETTTNSVRFFTNGVEVEDTSSVAVTVTVSTVDPNTGDFTNLAVLNGRAVIDVGGSCQFKIDSASFPLSDLQNPAAVRILTRRSSSIFNDPINDPYIGATFTAPGSLTADYFGPVFRADNAFDEGDRVTLDPRPGDNGAVSAMTFNGAITKQPFNSTTLTGNATVTRVVKDANGKITYVKFSGTFQATDGIGRTMSGIFSCGVGLVPS